MATRIICCRTLDAEQCNVPAAAGLVSILETTTPLGTEIELPFAADNLALVSLRPAGQSTEASEKASVEISVETQAKTPVKTPVKITPPDPKPCPTPPKN